MSLNIRSLAGVAACAAAVALFEVAFISLLPSPWRELHLAFDIIVLLLVTRVSRTAFVYAAVSGIIFDAYRVGGGMFAFGELLLITLCLSFAAERVVTNRSLYSSVALVILARLLERGWLFGVHMLRSIFLHVSSPLPTTSSVLITLGWDIAIISVVFVGFALITPPAYGRK